MSTSPRLPVHCPSIHSSVAPKCSTVSTPGEIISKSRRMGAAPKTLKTGANVSHREQSPVLASCRFM